MYKPKGLIILNPDAFTQIYGPDGLAAIIERIELIHPPITAIQLMTKLELLAEAEVIFSGWGAPRMDAAFLNAAPVLRAVFYGAGSIKGFTTEAFWAREITITSAYTQNAIPVAEYALSAILLSLKKFWHYAHAARRMGAHAARVTVPGAYCSRVGLVSMGTIARLLRERLRPFDLKVSAFDPFINDEQAKTWQVDRVCLEELFATCDVVSLHTPWLPETENMIDARLLRTMKPGATLLNTARGAIVNEPELIAVLCERPDLTAILDVTWPEPPVADSPLYTLPNVVLTPHIAGSLDQECRRMGDAMISEFDRWQAGLPLHWRITRQQAAVMA